MFTGIIKSTGKIIESTGSNIKISTNDSEILNVIDGTSVSVDGACLTVQTILNNEITFQISKETIDRTIISNYSVGVVVNLELPVKAHDYLSGHIVQGHIDDLSNLIEIKEIGNKQWKYTFDIKNTKYIVDKGSITINGISLTVVKPSKDAFETYIINETYKRTNIQYLEIGSQVNIEYDILSKYLERLTIDN
tara:strand:+ start:5650 stop:6228 length:579 start_codon:yes stop_codon:yes gene_type:complete